MDWEIGVNRYKLLHSEWINNKVLLYAQGTISSLLRLSDFTFTFHFHALEKEMGTHSSVLA